MSKIVKIHISESAAALLRSIASAPVPIPPRSPALVAANLSRVQAGGVQGAAASTPVQPSSRGGRYGYQSQDSLQVD